jgi:hypothetical protein
VPVFVVGLLTAIAMLLAGSAAQASTIYACKKKSGSLRLVSKKAKCKRGESKIAWNTTGPAGAKGTNGTNGSNGANGASGKEGAEGTALGYAHISPTGVVDPARSKNVTTANVVHLSPGADCFVNLPFTPHIVLGNLTNFTIGFVTVGVPPSIGSACPEPATTARVETFNIKGEATDAEVDVLFD